MIPNLSRRFILYAQKTGIFLGILIALFLILEWGARLVDSRIHFHYRVVQMIDMLQTSTQPEPAQTDLPWEDKRLYVRAPEPDTPAYREEIYIVGGRRIPGGHATLKIKAITPPALAGNDKKIFITGGSAAFGFPYLYPYAWAAILGEMLADKGYAVINAAQISFTSGKLVPVVRRIVDDYNPHTIVIMTGNNEWMSWKANDPPWGLQKMIGVFKELSASRLVAAAVFQGFKRRAAQDQKYRQRRKDFEIQKELAGFEYALKNPFEKYFHADPAVVLRSKQEYLKIFRDNLKKMVIYARRANVRVILTTVPFNHKLSPAFMYPQPESFQPELANRMHHAIHAAAGLIKEEKFEQALPVLDEAIRLDPLPPLPHYLKAYALEHLGRLPEAQAAYAQSRENMIGHLGSRLSINNVIREVSREIGTELLDIQKLFENYNRNRGQFFNEELIQDDCHPTPLSHRLMAAALYKEILAIQP